MPRKKAAKKAAKKVAKKVVKKVARVAKLRLNRAVVYPVIAIMLVAAVIGYYGFYPHTPITPDGDGDGDGTPPTSFTYDSKMLMAGYSAGLQQMVQSWYKYGSYYYMAVWNGLYSGTGTEIRCLEVDPVSMTVKRSVTVGNAVANDDHNKPSIVVTPSGTIIIVSMYTTGTKCWRGDASTLTFVQESGAPTGSYPQMYVSPSGQVFMLIRNSADASMIMAIRTGNNVWTTRNTIWKPSLLGWGGSLQDQCFYTGTYYKDGRFYVSGAGGGRHGYELRTDLWFAYTDDLGVTWHSSSGTTITVPERVYQGDTSRSSMTVDASGNIYILWSVILNNSWGKYYITYRENGVWKTLLLPLPSGQNCRGAQGLNCILHKDGVLHAFVVTGSDASPYTGGAGYDYYSVGDYTQWKSHLLSNRAFSREIVSEVFNSQIYLLTCEDSDQYLYKVTPVT